MSGTWTYQNKILPGAYINFLTNAPISITPGERGAVVLLQEMSVGVAGEIYTINATENNYPVGTTAEDKFLTSQILKGAQTVQLYNLGTAHDASTIETALNKIKTVEFDVLVYPYDGTGFDTNKATINTWLKSMVDTEGKGIQCVLANFQGDYEGVINVTHGVKLADSTELTPAKTTAWVAGITAGAKMYQSNTGRKYLGAIDVVPRMTKTEMEAAVVAGKFIFKVDNAQNVSVLYDINSLTTISTEKGKAFTKNRVIRTLNAINNDITEIFESNYVGKMNNNDDGRSLLRATIIDYFKELQRLSAIKNFNPTDVTISQGTDADSVVINCFIQPVDSVEKMYITVNLA